MRKRIATCLFITTLAIARAARAAGPATTQAADPAVAALIAQLDADDGQARDAAAAKLVELGEPIRSAMVDAAEHAASPEVRSRAAGVIAKLNQLAAERPTLVTLHVRDADPVTVFTDIARQSGIRIHYRPDTDGATPKLAISADGQPFWAVMASACRQAHVNPLDLDDDGVTLESNADSRLSAPASAIDPRLTFVALKAERARELSYLPNGVAKRSDTFACELFVDPKLQLLASHSAVLTEAVDDRGASMLPVADGSDPSAITWYANGNVDSLTCDLALPADPSRRLGRMSGCVSLLVGTRSEPVDVADVAASVGMVRPVGPLTMHVTHCRIGIHEGALDLNVTFPNKAWQKSVYSSCRRIRLIDAAGQTLSTREHSTERDQRTEFAFTYAGARSVREPVRLVWKPATEWREMRAQFEFKDLPLP